MDAAQLKPDWKEDHLLKIEARIQALSQTLRTSIENDRFTEKMMLAPVAMSLHLENINAIESDLSTIAVTLYSRESVLSSRISEFPPASRVPYYMTWGNEKYPAD